MIVDERLTTYINSLSTGNTEILNEIEREALADRVPIIRKEMQTLLKVLLTATRPTRILEVGTAVGFSCILMCTYNPGKGKVTTIEKYEKRFPIAEANFKRAGVEDRVEFLKGDAAEYPSKLDGPSIF